MFQFLISFAHNTKRRLPNMQSKLYSFLSWSLNLRARFHAYLFGKSQRYIWHNPVKRKQAMSSKNIAARVFGEEKTQKKSEVRILWRACVVYASMKVKGWKDHSVWLDRRCVTRIDGCVFMGTFKFVLIFHTKKLALKKSFKVNFTIHSIWNVWKNQKKVEHQNVAWHWGSEKT